MEFEPGTRKVQQRGSRFRSRQRTKAMAIALGVAMAITLGLLSLVYNTTAVGAENTVGPVTRHLRSLLLDQKVSEYGAALDQQPLAASMEATSRRSVPQSPGGPSGGGRAMEAIAPRYEKKAAPETIAEAVAKAEEAEEIAEEALIVALGAENDLQAIEAITEASILSIATNSITEGLGGEEIVIVGEIEDSDDSDDSFDSKEEDTTRKTKAKKHKDW